MKFTVLGGKGFVGSHFLKYFQEQNIECYAPDIRKENVEGKNLGNVIYSIGVPNFLERPLDAVEGHVCTLKKILSKTRYDSFVYFSGTRVYYEMSSTFEDQSITVNPNEMNDLYRISKLMGESTCLAMKNSNIHIARLSNVTGNNFTSHLFLPAVIRDAIEKKKMKVFTKLSSEKDYIHIDDVLKIIPEIALKGEKSIYNVAYGKNTKSKVLLDKIASLTDSTYEVEENSPEYSFPEISIDRIRDEFGFEPISVVDKLDSMVNSFKDFLNQS